MENTEVQCKHNRIPRNCYLCYLHRNDNKDYKTHMDTLHEILSELKIRIAKLEEYKRLQDDVNQAHGNQLFALHDLRLNLIQDIKQINKCIFDLNEFKLCQINDNHTIDARFNGLDEHRKKQIDENRAVSKHLDQHDEDVKYLVKEKIILEKRCDEIEELNGEILKGCAVVDKRVTSFLEGVLDRIEKLENLSDFKKLEACVLDGAQTHATVLKMEKHLTDLDESYQGLSAELKYHYEWLQKLSDESAIWKSAQVEQNMQLKDLTLRICDLETMNQKAIDANPIKDIYPLAP